jgi:hypothetical protein
MPVSRYEVEITNRGYLYLSADLASTRFPYDALFATLESGNLVLWPTSGATAGGLLLKQRNVSGDRCVLMSEIFHADTTPGKREAVWDDRRCHLSIPLIARKAPQAVAANTLIQEECGRWVVYLEVGFWEPSGSAPLKVTRNRIRDYPTRRDAEVAASWIQRSAERNVSRPVEGS